MMESPPGAAGGSLPSPDLLEWTGAAAFVLSGLLTGLVAINAWPDLVTGNTMAQVLHLWLFRTGMLFSTILALSVAWLLPRRTSFPWLGLLAIPLLLRYLRDLFWAPAPWPVGFGILAAGYLVGALATAVVMLVRSSSTRTG